MKMMGRHNYIRIMMKMRIAQRKINQMLLLRRKKMGMERNRLIVVRRRRKRLRRIQ